MVYEKYETWPMWLAVNIGYVILYMRQELLFTTVLYIAFTLMAAIGWRRWYESHQRTLRSV